MKKINFEKFNTCAIHSLTSSKIVGGRVYTEGGKSVDQNGNGFAWESDHIDGKVTTYNQDGFKCISGNTVVQC
jgi:hypothetical protein